MTDPERRATRLATTPMVVTLTTTSAGLARVMKVIPGSVFRNPRPRARVTPKPSVDSTPDCMVLLEAIPRSARGR